MQASITLYEMCRIFLPPTQLQKRIQEMRKLWELTLFINKHKPDIITLNETLTIKNNTYSQLQNYISITEPRKRCSNNPQTQPYHRTTTNNNNHRTHSQSSPCHTHPLTNRINTSRSHLLSPKKPISRNHQHHLHTTYQNNHNWRL